MFRLILDHPYKHVAAAIDVSGADNHGLVHDVSFVPNGALPGSGALNFALPSSRVRLGSKPVFGHLHALKIEMTVRVHSLGQRRILVEGDNSFVFFIEDNGVLVGMALGRESPEGSLDWYGADTHTHSTGNDTATVPVNKWVKLGYIHDGFAAIQLYMDDRLVAVKRNLYSPIRPVGPSGVHIGNRTSGDANPFHGDIDGIRMWSWDPNAAYYQFFCRQVFCKAWKSVFDSLGTFSAGPEGLRRLESLLRCIGTIQTEIVRAVRRQDETIVRANDNFSRRYRELWCKGEIEGDEMRDLLKEWLRVIEQILGRDRLGELVRAMVDCARKHGVIPAIPDRIDFNDCDPDFVGFIRNLTSLTSHLVDR